MAKRRAHGEGSLYKRASDGRWVAALPAALSPTKKRLVAYGRTKADATAKLDDLKGRAREGRLAAPSTRTVGALLAEFLDTLRAGGKSRRTYDTYALQVRLYLTPRLGAMKLTDLKPAHLARLYADLLDHGRQRGAGGLSSTYVNVTHRTMHLALALAVKWRYLARNVADDVASPRPNIQEAVTLSDDQLRAFLDDAARRHDPWLACWHLAADTGLRRSELVGLRWDDLTDEGGRTRVQVRRMLENDTIGPPVFKEPKTKRSRRVVTLTVATANALAAHRDRQDQARAADLAWTDYRLLFPARHGLALPGHLLYSHFKRAARRAGLPAGLRLHGLRHTAATLWLSGGVPVDAVSRRLGHANSAITLGVYSHAVPTSEDAATALMERLLAPRGEPPPVEAPVDLEAARRKRETG